MLPALALGGLLLIAGAVRMSPVLTTMGLTVMLWSGWSSAILKSW